MLRYEVDAKILTLLVFPYNTVGTEGQIYTFNEEQCYLVQANVCACMFATKCVRVNTMCVQSPQFSMFLPWY